jgi:alpha-D-ribose 1-methylphosphonate 5-triphosphate diphosphatase PhnM
VQAIGDLAAYRFIEGRIYAFAESQSRLPGALNGEGGWLLPGLIELHTDNLDKSFPDSQGGHRRRARRQSPRRRVRW